MSQAKKIKVWKDSVKDFLIKFPPEAKKMEYFGSLQAGNVQKRVHFRGPPQAPRKRGKIRYTKGESPPQAENFGDFGPLKC